MVDQEDPLNSYLKIGSGIAPKLSTMGIMRAPSVRARLVSLAACDSALGNNVGGNGLLGLTREFQLAGAQSVLATLWRVSDLPTQQLRIAIYSELAVGQPLDLALAHAQRQLLHSTPTLWEHWLGSAEDPGDPYYWSRFSLSGSLY